MGASNRVCAKRLKEHLQDQQEPFSLSSFLLERNYMIKNLRSKNLTLRSHKGKYGVCKMREKILHGTEIIRSVIINLVSTDDSHESSNCTSDQRSLYAQREAAKANKSAPLRDSLSPHAFWGISIQTVPTTRLKMEETGAVTLHPWISRYEKQQGQRVTRLRESTYRESPEFSIKPKIAHLTTQDDLIDRAVLNFKRGKDLSTYTFTLPQESVGNSMLSATLGKLLLDPDILKHGDVNHDALKQMRRIVSVPPYLRKKRIPLKMRPFQLQCVQEALQFWLDCVDKRANRSGLSLQSSPTAEGCANSQTVDTTNIAMEIGDAIMDDMVNEMVGVFLVQN